jgi:hypothetical protein
MKVKVFLTLTLLLGFGALAATAQATTQSGLFFTIHNACPGTVSGFAVGDELCLLNIGTATYTRAIFQGTLAASASTTGMACTGTDGNASVIFVPAAGSGTSAVVVTVAPDQVVNIPSTFCGPTTVAAPETELLRQP